MYYVVHKTNNNTKTDKQSQIASLELYRIKYWRQQPRRVSGLNKTYSWNHLQGNTELAISG